MALLLVGLACIALALVEARRSVTSNAQVARRALVGYSSFAAWSYREHLTEAVRMMAREVLGSVNHGNAMHTGPKIPNARELGHYLPWDPGCNCHVTRAGALPSAFLGFRLGSDTLQVGLNQSRTLDGGWLVDDPAHRPAVSADEWIGPAARKWLVDTLTTISRRGRTEWGYDLILQRVGDSTLMVLSTIMPTSWGDTIVYAAAYHSSSADSLLASVLDAPGLMPAEFNTQGTNRELLSLEVRDRTGHQLLGSRLPTSWRSDDVSRLPDDYGGLRIHVQIRPDLADKLVIGGLPRSRLPLLLALLVLAAGLTAVAFVQLRREARFAEDRAAFVANVSHELRTPLAQIRLATDTLRLGRESDPVRRTQSLALVDREVTRLQHLVEGVVRFTRSSKGAAPLARDVVDAAAEARQVVAEFAPLAAPRNVRLEVRADAPVPVAVEAGALRQVLLNLLDNAVKYGPDGQQVTVAVQPHGTGVRIVVTD